jgi:hypothetical protein
MNIIRHRVLRLVAISAVATVIPQLALAMGPTSAAIKNQNVRAANDSAVTPVTKCIPSEGTCPRPHHRAKH